MNIPIIKADYIIKRRGKYLLLKNRCGTKVKFDGKSVVKMITRRIAAAKAFGICGNCDGDHTNDYLLSDGTDVNGVPKRDILIGNNWWFPQPGEIPPQ